MRIRLNPAEKNQYPISGFLIRGGRVGGWILALQELGVMWNEVSVHPLPGTGVNTVWGCLVLHNDAAKLSRRSPHESVQGIFNLVFIPERSTLMPFPGKDELVNLVKNRPHVFHPEIGFVELPPAVQITELLSNPEERSVFVNLPVPPRNIPVAFNEFLIRQRVGEEVLNELEKNAVPERKSLREKPLNVFEKIKLEFYKAILPKKNDGAEDAPEGNEDTKSKLGRALSDLKKNMQIDLEELERRNAKAIDRLMEMLKNNPEEAMKYALPIGDGMGRGSDLGEFAFGKMLSDFSLFGTSGGSGGGGTIIISNDKLTALQNGYRKLAEFHIGNGDFEKAAYVYMKLLKDYYTAAATLEKGGLYKEAAFLYHQKLKMPDKAAECYERAGLIENSIEIRVELKQFEKCGDLLLRTGRRAEAMKYYQQQVDNDVSQKLMRKAAEIYLSKMDMIQEGRLTLREGWRYKRDIQGCLSRYISTFSDGRERVDEVHRLVRSELETIGNSEILDFLKEQYKLTESRDEIRELAYPLISQGIRTNPQLAYMIPKFNAPSSGGINRDVLRFVRAKRKKL